MDAEMETWRKSPGEEGSDSGRDRKKCLEPERARDPETKLEEKQDQERKRPKIGSETLGKTLRDTGGCREL